MNDTVTATPEERIAAYRSDHRIVVVETTDPDLGRITRCELDGIRVHPMRDGRYRHDTRAATDLLNEVYGGVWFRRDADELERRIERVADLDEEPNLEGMPEFNGSFR